MIRRADSTSRCKIDKPTAIVRKNPDSNSLMRYQILYDDDPLPEGFDKLDDLASRVRKINPNYSLLYQSEELRKEVRKTIDSFVSPAKHHFITA